MNNKTPQIVISWMLLLQQISTALPSTTKHLLPIVVNRVLGTNASCDSRNLNVSVHFQFPFKGILFAKDFSQECKSLGSFANDASVSLPTSGCGVRLASREDKNGGTSMFYTVSVVAQQDRHLRQISDQERVIECPIEDSAFEVKSKPMKDALGYNKGSSRTGRMKEEGWSKDFGDYDENDKSSKELEGMLSAARAWMEITSAKSSASSNLQVGELALLAVKCTLPAGIGWKVVDCTAHDGLGESSQKLLDEEGCPVDEVLLPLPKFGPVKQMELMRHQEAVAEFSAFKFPDRDRLHLSCGLQLCRGFCENVDCSNANGTGDRLARTLGRGEKGEILDRLEIFNSVQVRAPAIELDQSKTAEKSNSRDAGSLSPFGHLPGDRAFCVSPDKMALTFCILGLIFLCAVIVATLALLRARRAGENLVPYYTRSLFSSRSSSTGSGGSKLLLHESPYLRQSTSGGLHYGRIL